jgi:uncharacterized protein involved in propanediol utilization
MLHYRLEAYASVASDDPKATMDLTIEHPDQIAGRGVSLGIETLLGPTPQKQWVAGKVGEWLQGVDREGKPIVYALAVNSSPFRTVASVEPVTKLTVMINPDAPADSAKVKKAINELASSYGCKCTCRVIISGSPPRGKGLGSSSIDIASALLAIKELLALRISASELFKLMCRVERSDYLFNPESIVAANPSDGSCSVVGRAPKCLVLAWDTDPSGTVNTEAVRHLDNTRRSFRQEYWELAGMIQSGETEMLLRAATRSSEINDSMLPKIGFAAARKFVNELPKVGLIAAHTGTYLGFVLPEPIDPDLARYVRDFIVDRYRAKPLVFGVGGR